MKSYQDWLTESTDNKKTEEKPEKGNKRPRGKKLKKSGGVYVDPKIAQRIDLTVLPGGVEGKNCGNCEYFEKSGDMGWCQNPEVKQWVTARMCCSLWDHPQMKRSWKKT